MKKIIIYFALLFSFSSFAERLDYSARAEKIRSQIIKKLKDELKISCYGGGGGYQGNVNYLSSSIEVYQIATIEQARNIFLYIMNNFIDALNADHIIRPYLNHFPANQSNIELTLRFIKSANENSEEQFIHTVHLIKNKLVYFINGSVVYEEPYEEALKKNTFKNN